jgi:hypothetical protein
MKNAHKILMMSFPPPIEPTVGSSPRACIAFFSSQIRAASPHSLSEIFTSLFKGSKGTRSARKRRLRAGKLLVKLGTRRTNGPIRATVGLEQIWLGSGVGDNRPVCVQEPL